MISYWQTNWMEVVATTFWNFKCDWFMPVVLVFFFLCRLRYTHSSQCSKQQPEGQLHTFSHLKKSKMSWWRHNKKVKCWANLSAKLPLNSYSTCRQYNRNYPIILNEMRLTIERWVVLSISLDSNNIYMKKSFKESSIDAQITIWSETMGLF